MKRLLPVLLMFALTGNIQFAQESTAYNYFPLAIGNVWIYNCTSIGMACNCTAKYRIKVVSSVIINSKKYFIFQRSSAFGSCWNGCVGPAVYDSLRVDSLTGNMYRYSAQGCINSPFEIMVDSLNARLNDTVRNNCGTSQYKYICMDTSSQNIFGTQRRSKAFNETQFETGYGRAFAEGIGMISSGYGSIVCSNNNVLVGCVINGILYGDTSMIVGINQISTEVPENFSLSQNYPNPFNPATNINFQIPKSEFVTLVVYDALGKEIQTLVNQQLSPGTYEVDFDASRLPSGVYYYNLEAGEFTQTKKMVLIK